MKVLLKNMAQGTFFLDEDNNLLMVIESPPLYTRHHVDAPYSTFAVVVKSTTKKEGEFLILENVNCTNGRKSGEKLYETQIGVFV